MKRPFYTPDEDAILREHYAAKGAAWIFQSGLLPGRCDRSIKSRAQHIGLAVPGRTMPRTDGIKNLSDFKARCRISGIDGEDNCWVYCGNGDERADLLQLADIYEQLLAALPRRMWHDAYERAIQQPAMRIAA